MILEAAKSKIMAPAQSDSGEGLLLGHRLLTSHCVLTVGQQGALWSRFYKSINPIHTGSTPTT